MYAGPRRRAAGGGEREGKVRERRAGERRRENGRRDEGAARMAALV